MIKTNVLACLLLGAAISQLQAQISITDYSSTYFQDFDTLASAGISGVLPTGWALSETGSAANLLYSAGNGSATTADTYSFGSTGSSDRALGTQQNPVSDVPTIGVAFRNDGTMNIHAFTISYRGEEWRCQTVKWPDRLDFQFSTNAISLTTGTWTDVNALDFATPNLSIKGAVDGNAVGNFTDIAPTTIGGLSIAPGATIWFRWVDFDGQGADDGLAVDNFSVSYAVPEPHSGVLLGISLLIGLKRRRS